MRPEFIVIFVDDGRGLFGCLGRGDGRRFLVGDAGRLFVDRSRHFSFGMVPGRPLVLSDDASDKLRRSIDRSIPQQPAPGQEGRNQRAAAKVTGTGSRRPLLRSLSSSIPSLHQTRRADAELECYRYRSCYVPKFVGVPTVFPARRRVDRNVTKCEVRIASTLLTLPRRRMQFVCTRMKAHMVRAGPSLRSLR